FFLCLHYWTLGYSLSYMRALTILRSVSAYEEKDEIIKLSSTIQRYCFCKRVSIIITGSEYWHKSPCLASPPSDKDIASRSRNFCIHVFRIFFIGCANHHSLQCLTTVYTLCKEYVEVSCVIVCPS